CVCCVFFFQAEDGIRYWSVTGVQTCALPISRIMSALVFFQVSAIIVILGAELNRGIVEVKRLRAVAEGPNDDATTLPLPPTRARSEERRVGKEWRCRWAPYH